MKTETNELVYQAVDPGLAEKMRNLGYVRGYVCMRLCVRNLTERSMAHSFTDCSFLSHERTHK